MGKSFWQLLPKPSLVLAPMDDVTDVVFREIVASTARPDVFVTEFTNCDALCSEGRTAQMRRLLYTENQRPIVAQIWGSNPDTFEKTGRLIRKLGFDGVDINMGCPISSITKSGGCSALIQHPSLAKKIIEATRAGAGDLPLSVKTRLGGKKIQTEEWIGFLLECDLDALIIHGRTVQEMSKVPAHWDEIGKAVQLRNGMKKSTVIIGNGDVKNAAEAEEKHTKFGVDGVMIGRGIFTDMWAFDRTVPHKVPTIQEQLQLLVDHVTLFEKTWGATKQYNILKKFFKIYVNGFAGAHELRMRLMETQTLQEVREIVVPMLSV